MPVNYKNYPANWKELSKRIREQRAGNRCECPGGNSFCNKEHNGRCNRENKVNRVVLTVAHLHKHECKCDPLCAIEDHLLAMCQSCHLNYDKQQRVTRAKKTRIYKVTLANKGIICNLIAAI